MEFAVSADIIAEFLEVAIHQILFSRELYPHAAFSRRKKYNIPVQMSIHPGLHSYISNCVSAIKPLLDNAEVQKVVVAVIQENGTPVEKFVFDIKQSVTLPQNIREDDNLVKLEESLRAFCLKLSISDSLLKPLPANCSFAVQLHVPQHVQVKMSENAKDLDFPWIEAEKEQVEISNSHIIPLKTLKSEVCQMQLFVEESPNK